MLPFTSFTCCGGRVFVNLPLLGLFEAKFAAGLGAGLVIIAAFMFLLRRFIWVIMPTVVVVGAIAVKIGADQTKDEAGVKGWMRALEMSRVDVASDALRQWAYDTTQRLKWFRENAPQPFNLSHFEVPRRFAVLSLNESKEAVALLLR